jgi:hypothetical protein
LCTHSHLKQQRGNPASSARFAAFLASGFIGAIVFSYHAGWQGKRCTARTILQRRFIALPAQVVIPGFKERIILDALTLSSLMKLQEVPQRMRIRTIRSGDDGEGDDELP